ncbi:MAG TPA: hypothetical protein V6D47_14725 [Oscillatoriaceae cyanobacterium]
MANKHKPRKRIDAECFRLVDGTGKIRAKLDVVQGDAALRMYDDWGSIRLKADVDANGTPSLTLYDGNSEVRVFIKIQPDGRVGLGILGEHGEPQLGLGVDADKPLLVVHDPSGACVRMTVSIVDGRLHFEEEHQP